MVAPVRVLQTDPKHAQGAVYWRDLLLTCGQDKAIKAWCGDELAWQLEGHTATSYGLSLRGDRLLSGGSDHTLRCWDLAARKQLWVAEGIDHGTWNHDGTRILSHKKSKRIAILDAAGEQTRLLPAVEPRLFGSDWNGDAALLGGANDIHVISPDPDDEPVTWSGHTTWVTNIRAAPGGDLIASAGMDGRLIFWNTDGTLSGEVDCPTGVGLCWDAAGDRVARSSDHRIAVYSAPNGGLLWETDVPVKGVYGPGFSPDGSELAVACADGAVRVYQID